MEEGVRPVKRPRKDGALLSRMKKAMLKKKKIQRKSLIQVSIHPSWAIKVQIATRCIYYIPDYNLLQSPVIIHPPMLFITQ